tara:strand:+ start:2548 stop:4602 length:2055 start_codon:yes stop_codon:yes gene_type:complete
MAQMSELELLANLEAAEEDATIFNGEFTKENERYLKEYLGRPYGDEVPDQSSVVSTDVADVVESDMPSLARIFMGSGDIITFQPNTDNPKEVQEAEDKTKYINWLVRSQPNSFHLLHSWMKDAEIQKNGVVKYSVEDFKSVEEVKYTGVDQDEFSGIVESLKNSKVDKIKVEVADQLEDEDTGKFDISFRVTKERKRPLIINVPPESFLITKNANSIDDALMVGDRIRKTRGELIADGFPKKLIDLLPTQGDQDIRSTTIQDIRNRDQGGADLGSEDMRDWAGQHVDIVDMYVKIDFDGDGIAERRHVMKSGNTVLINEAFDHVPYASLSAILMPHKAIGRSRAEITSSTQKQKTVLLRGMLNNMYMVNNPRNVVHPDVDLDDMLAVRTNGIIRMEDDTQILPQNAVFPLQIPYIGDRTLQVLQYVDQAKAQSTGALLANQGLDSDAIGRETATRFTGVEEAGEAKIELIARNYAETGFRKLYEGLAWMVSRFQDTETEFRVLGKALTVNPKSWKYSHHIVSNVGLGAANNDQLIQSLQGIYGIQQQLKLQGSALTDEKDIYNTLDRIVKGLGLPSVDEFFNDPEQPDELLQAQNEILTKTVEQLQGMVQSMQNPLAEAETIKAEAKLVEAEGKQELDAATMLKDMKQFQESQAADMKKHNDGVATRLTELELKYQADVPGALV